MFEGWRSELDVNVSSNLKQEDYEPMTVIDQLIGGLNDYMKKRPHLSVNAISRKCNVSEPTLRRILSRKIKTLPQVTTVLDILTFLCQEKSVQKIIELYPGPIATYLKEAMPYLVEFDEDYSIELNYELKNPVKYLIFKLAANSAGVRQSKVVEMFGQHGLQMLEEMLQNELVVKSNGVYRTKARTFKLSNDDFVRNFKLVADYIKPHAATLKDRLNPLFVNRSSSVNADTFEKVVKIQRKALIKINRLLEAAESEGSIPLFLLLGVDTLDSASAAELNTKE